MVAINPNDLPMDFQFWKYFGDQIAVEHGHQILGQPGTVRLLGYRNGQNLGRFDDAVAAFRADPRKNALYVYPNPNPQLGSNVQVPPHTSCSNFVTPLIIIMPPGGLTGRPPETA
jgi:hypothetical protein